MKQQFIKFLTPVAVLILLSASGFGQSRTNRLYRPCPASSTPAVVEVERDGDINLNQCSGRTVSVNGSNLANVTTAAAVVTDNAIIRGDGVARGVQTSLATVSDTGTINIPDVQSYSIAGTQVVTHSSGSGATTFTGAFNVYLDNGGGSLFFRTGGVNRASVTSTNTSVLSGVFNTLHGTAVPSAAAIVPTGNLFHVTGVASITSITSTNITAGTEITIIFDGILTFTDGSNLKLAGNFVTTADDTITLVYDGTNWYETARAIN